MTSDARPSKETHRVEGTGEDTRVVCHHNNVTYGPHADAKSGMAFCPYCGKRAVGEHEADDDLGEVFCPDTTMSTWRYCPGCGEVTR